MFVYLNNKTNLLPRLLDVHHARRVSLNAVYRSQNLKDYKNK